MCSAEDNRRGGGDQLPMALHALATANDELGNQLDQSLDGDERAHFERIMRVTGALIESMQQDRGAVHRALYAEDDPEQLLRDYNARIEAAVERLHSLREQLGPLVAKLSQRNGKQSALNQEPVADRTRALWDDGSIASFAAALRLDYKPSAD